MCEYKALDGLTKKCIKDFYKNYIDYDEYYDGNNDLSYLFYECSSDYIKNDEEALNFLSKNIKDIFEFNKKYSKDENRYKDGEDRYRNLLDGMEFYGRSPSGFIENYIQWNFNWNYSDTIENFSLSWLNNHKSLCKEWYSLLCTIVDSL